MYCIYVTFYRGNKLPPFYVGSTTVERIKNGYRGSVATTQYKLLWKKEQKENPHLFKTVILKTFKTRQWAYVYESKMLRKLKVYSNVLYINYGNKSIPKVGLEQEEQPKKKRKVYTYNYRKIVQPKIVTYAKISYQKRSLRSS